MRMHHNTSTPAVGLISPRIPKFPKPYTPFLLRFNQSQSLSSRSGRHRIVLRVENHCSAMAQQIGASVDASNEAQGLNRNLYATIEPYSSGYLKVSDLHTLYWEQSGNPSGHPVVFLHGGPGAGTSANNRRFFDPEFYRIILFDQRGAGKSTPHACLEENTTWDLVDDIEKLREHLGISEWQVFGGSWGSTLALAYSQSHPDKVTGIVLRGIFLLRKKELDWFYEGGAAAIFPDAWEPFRDFIPENERGSLIKAYHKRLNSDDMQTKLMAAKIWTTWELMTAHLIPNEANIKKGEDDTFNLAFARIENHYFVNKGFLPADSYLVSNIDKIRHIKTVIVQGRYDVCCPMMSAWDLHKEWPEAEFKVVPDAGHSANEVGIAAELVAANEKLKNILKSGGI
ncbi:proline iminopeptidase isoform X1 [Dioscorea cayenensis subsp. rotundata]|uniref:Proline iminopeptidase n=1 Tax=Dioscorea cayennensis subsp. rotundata TaxID=55577 RepID=A0AB40B3V1_DIOCR|nr:proline iminopeptidase isoform X1 [Dioscorea cayenensis subsp. rotundata]XP_039121783.1 proline iminopeptidase isoform X1 [Dioscorea cayenensis subsp. rotundata]